MCSWWCNNIYYLYDYIHVLKKRGGDGWADSAHSFLSAKEERSMTQVARLQPGKRVPAYVLVGFLGSGKTTVLAQLIEWCVDNHLKPGLIINEFGDISIDGEAVRQVGMQMTELTNGCVCCTAGMEMTMSLMEMASRPDIDLIFLEATGLADPADMLDELTEPFLWECVEIGGIISVVDSKRFIELAEDVELARHQVEYADVLVMNKCDLISREWRDALAAYLPVLAPHAKIFQAEEGQPYEGVEALLSYALSVGRGKHQNGHEKHEHHNHEEHEHGHAHESIHSMGFPLDIPVDRRLFERFIEGLPQTVYRAKGFVMFLNNKQTFLFQYVPGSLYIKAFSIADHSLLRGVFIGQNLEKEWLANKLIACQATVIARKRDVKQRLRK
jgi:G3E family GTPase